ncbi:hypothetical protein Patl1_20710 [Pistacia atlantica]|uniref:Uncharacterized protein n=1 Tax=Pistacia atlantica TaxID=434234 RepID=A0ACC1BLR9_9ROSI|nr:hypothetical protein Patl1_20710 [Pistacia atlantica]
MKTSSDSTITTSFSSQHQASMSAEIIANNDDLLTEMLLCLPLKSLVKFKSVSKHWLSLISNPNFSLRFSLIPQPITGLFMRGLSCKEYYFINLSSSPSPAPFKYLTLGNNPSDFEITIRQSCNGLLLCSRSNSKKPDDHYVYNPTTQEYTMLPPPPLGTGVCYFGFNLAFDPLKSPHYTIICVKNCNNFEDDSYQIDIFSSKTRTWRLSRATFIVSYYASFTDGVYWNGSIHWINEQGPSLHFNIDKEEVQEMSVPPIPDGQYWRSFYYLGVSRDHLHLIENYAPCAALFNVYEMENDYSGWFIKYRVDLRQAATTFPEMIRSHINPEHIQHYKISTICVVREENEEESYLVVHIPGKSNLHESVLFNTEKVLLVFNDVVAYKSATLTW